MGNKFFISMALGFILNTGPVLASLEQVNLFGPEAYVSWETLELDWGGTGETSWIFNYRVTNNLKDEIEIIGTRAYLVDLKVNTYLTYSGEGIWQGSNGLVGKTVNIDGYDYFPQELSFYAKTVNPDLKYPYIKIGDLLPGDNIDVNWKVDWINMPNWYSIRIATDTTGYVPEPATITLLGLGGVLLKRKRRFHS